MNDLTPDLAELRRLAEAATQGPWDYYRPHPNYRAYAVDRVMPGGYLGEDVATTGDVCAEENGAYIAAANPAAVLGLLDRLAHMTEARDNARAEVERLAAKVERVRALHQREVIAVHEFGPEAWCPTCELHYPCPTACAIDGAES